MSRGRRHSRREAANRKAAWGLEEADRQREAEERRVTSGHGTKHQPGERPDACRDCRSMASVGPYYNELHS